MTRKKPYDPLEHCACRVCKGIIPPPDWDALRAVPDELVDTFETASLEAVHGHKSTSPIAEADAYVRGGLLPVLAAHKAMVRIEMVAAGWESPAQVEQFAADRDRFADLLSWQIDLHRSKPNHGNLDRRGCQGCQQFAAIREHPAIVAAREERMLATAEALVTGNYLACPAPEERGEE